jgi:hypothetical protein
VWHWDHSDLVSKLHEEELGNTNLAAMNNAPAHGRDHRLVAANERGQEA